jgi:hypothetical protein
MSANVGGLCYNLTTTKKGQLMSITTYDVACDKCERGFAIDDVYNVEYADRTMNVLCGPCADEAETFHNVVDVWQSSER